MKISQESRVSHVPVSCSWRHILRFSQRVSTLAWQNQADVMWSRENIPVLEKKKKKSALFNKKELLHWWSEAGMSSMTCCGFSCRDVAFCGREQCPEPISWRWETNAISQLLAVREGENLSGLIPIVRCSASTQLQWRRPYISMQQKWVVCPNIGGQGSVCMFKYLIFLSQVLCVSWIQMGNGASALASLDLWFPQILWPNSQSKWKSMRSTAFSSGVQGICDLAVQAVDSSLWAVPHLKTEGNICRANKGISAVQLTLGTSAESSDISSAMMHFVSSHEK